MSDWRVEMFMKEAEKRGEHLTPEEASGMISGGQVVIGLPVVETHNEDYYYVTKELLTEEQVLQDATDDGLFMVSEKKVPLWTYGDTPERKGKPRPFGFNSTARGPDECNL